MSCREALSSCVVAGVQGVSGARLEHGALPLPHLTAQSLVQLPELQAHFTKRDTGHGVKLHALLAS